MEVNKLLQRQLGCVETYAAYTGPEATRTACECIYGYNPTHLKLLKILLQLAGVVICFVNAGLSTGQLECAHSINNVNFPDFFDLDISA